MLAGVAVGAPATGAAPPSSTCSATPRSRRCSSWPPGCDRPPGRLHAAARHGRPAPHRPPLAGLFALGLAALAGLPPLSGFWSKEAVLSAAEAATPRRLARPARPRQRPADHAGHRRLRGSRAGRRRARRPAGHAARASPPPTSRRRPGPATPTGSRRARMVSSGASMTVAALGARRADRACSGWCCSTRRTPCGTCTSTRSPPSPGTALSVAGLTWGLACRARRRRPRRRGRAAGAVSGPSCGTGYRLDDRPARRSSSGPTRRSPGSCAPATGTSSTATSAPCRWLSRWGSALLARAQSGLATGYLAWLAAAPCHRRRRGGAVVTVPLTVQ